MKISCEIIKDLLPLYHDGICSNETRELVEEHLKTCDGCKAELAVMDNTLPILHSEQNLAEAKAFKTLSRKWKKGMLQSLAIGVLITILTYAGVLLVLYMFMGIKISK